MQNKDLQFTMLGSYFGHFLDRPLSLLARKINLAPNTITVIGLLMTLVAALVLSWNLLMGGILILLSGLFDILDGVAARTHNRVSEFGAFFDSVIDRYSDSVLFAGLAWYFLASDSMTGAWLSIGSMIGALLVSYTRARAEGLGRECKAGIMERPERIVLMAFGAITGWILPVMWVMFVLTHVTVMQRMYYVWKKLK